MSMNVQRMSLIRKKLYYFISREEKFLQDLIKYILNIFYIFKYFRPFLPFCNIGISLNQIHLHFCCSKNKLISKKILQYLGYQKVFNSFQSIKSSWCYKLSKRGTFSGSSGTTLMAVRPKKPLLWKSFPWHV